MVQLTDQWLRVLVDIGEVDDPASCGIDLAFDRDIDLIAVAVHAGALVPGRHSREEVRRLEPEASFEPHPHDARL